uniref:CCHC-type domain-containing protein n=2 Tax=Hordeum vulgare subsp. vulgare TaxID=112509 RepID=A0A8I6WVP6_HORVV
MVCCHALKVMIELKLATIPDKYIMKRWTKDARDILPEHLARYERDKGPRGYETYRHNAMYIKAFKCVRLGDNNVKFYYVFMAMMKEVYTTLLPLSQGKDGMGLEEREAAQGRPAANGTYASIADGTNFMGQCETMSNCSGIALAPSKRPAGRPTTSREKASYEHKQKRSRFCKICRGEGHKSTTCPDRGDLPKPPRKMPRCSKCGVLGHLKNLCGKTTDPFEPNFL